MTPMNAKNAGFRSSVLLIAVQPVAEASIVATVILLPFALLLLSRGCRHRQNLCWQLMVARHRQAFGVRIATEDQGP